MTIILPIIMALLGGPAIAWAVQQKGAKNAFEKRKANFAAGKGKDPEKDFFGPHKSYRENFIAGAIMMFIAGIAAMIGMSLVS